MTTSPDPTARDIRDALIRIEAKLDAHSGIPAARPVLTGDELRELLTKIDSFHTQVSRGFDEIQAKIADVIARDAAEAVRVRSDLAARKDRP